MPIGENRRRPEEPRGPNPTTMKQLPTNRCSPPRCFYIFQFLLSKNSCVLLVANSLYWIERVRTNAETAQRPGFPSLPCRLVLFHETFDQSGQVGTVITHEWTKIGQWFGRRTPEAANLGYTPGRRSLFVSWRENSSGQGNTLCRDTIMTGHDGNHRKGVDQVGRRLRQSIFGWLSFRQEETITKVIMSKVRIGCTYPQHG
jgi:hypothetical protein